MFGLSGIRKVYDGRETDKQRICINMQLKKIFTQLKWKEWVLKQKSLYANKFTCAGHVVFWAGRRIYSKVNFE